jgi:hypothetical protein
MQDQEPFLNQIDEPSKQAALFENHVRSARIKSALVAIVPTILIWIAFLTSPPFGKDILPNLISFILLTVVPYTLTYQLVFSLGFGKKLLPKLYEKYESLEPMPYTDTCTQQAIDALNMARGHAPGKGYVVPPEPTKIDWDSHHYH